MDRTQIEQVLHTAEAAVARGEGLAGTGFWKAVAAVKSDPTLVPVFAGRIAAVDRAAFERWALLTVPVGAGTTVMALGVAVGFGAVWSAYDAAEPWNGLLLLIGTVVLLVATHSLTHLVVGRAQGMRFTHWFIGTITRPQPGVKVDYATYLAVPARRRAWMHASGAVATKLVPFLLLGPALVIPVPGWTTGVLVALGAGQILTDVLWSVKASDWKKYRREMGYAAVVVGE